MRYAIISDIHGNYDALDETLRTIDERECDLIVNLGDVVGYGAEPNRCIEALRERNVRNLAGNHDHVAIGLLNLDFFNEFAREAAVWTREQLTPENVEWLKRAPFVEHYPTFSATHSTLHSPEAFNYILTLLDARLSFDLLDRPVCFMGHSHMQVTFFDTEPVTYSLEERFSVNGDHKLLVNVGSVGQPRDENPLASFAVYDEGKKEIEIVRVPYDLRSAAEKILRAGLPELLAFRLFQGR